jgi:hypothetical protein
LLADQAQSSLPTVQVLSVKVLQAGGGAIVHTGSSLFVVVSQRHLVSSNPVCLYTVHSVDFKKAAQPVFLAHLPNE